LGRSFCFSPFFVNLSPYNVIKDKKQKIVITLKIQLVMGKLSKILVTIGVVFLFFVIFGVIAGTMSAAGRTPGIFGLIVMGALYGALKAIWKKPKKEDGNDNSSILQK
jgi:hypothetical protein